MNLRARTIRLAYENPALREKLLPLLARKTAGRTVTLPLGKGSVEIDRDLAEAALRETGVNPDRIRSILPTFSGDSVRPMTPGELKTLTRAGVLPKPGKAPSALSPSSAQRALDTWLRKLPRENEPAAPGTEFDLAEGIYLERSREIAPLLTALGISRRTAISMIAEALSG